MDLEKFYFTYGSDDVQPYCGGWTEVWAPNYQMACQAFRAVHPDRIPNILNCSSVYSAREFEKTKMFGPGGNFGLRCRETITGMARTSWSWSTAPLASTSCSKNERRMQHGTGYRIAGH